MISNNIFNNYFLKSYINSTYDAYDNIFNNCDLTLSNYSTTSYNSINVL